MIILEVIIIILLIRMIMNQHILDEHLNDISREGSKGSDDYIHYQGLINIIIFKIEVLYSNIIYYFKHKKESK